MRTFIFILFAVAATALLRSGAGDNGNRVLGAFDSNAREMAAQATPAAQSPFPPQWEALKTQLKAAVVRSVPLAPQPRAEAISSTIREFTRTAMQSIAATPPDGIWPESALALPVYDACVLMKEDLDFFERYYSHMPEFQKIKEYLTIFQHTLVKVNVHVWASIMMPMASPGGLELKINEHVSAAGYAATFWAVDVAAQALIEQMTTREETSQTLMRKSVRCPPEACAALTDAMDVTNKFLSSPQLSQRPQPPQKVPPPSAEEFAASKSHFSRLLASIRHLLECSASK